MIKFCEIKKILNIIKSCSKIAMKHYNNNNLKVSFKDDYSPITRADIEISEVATEKLKKIFQNDVIISEEKKIKNTEFNCDRFWLIDPIDGTKEFLKKSGNFTINFALIVLGKPIFGIICQPTTSSVWYNFEGKSYKISNSFNIEKSFMIEASQFNEKKPKLICSSSNYETGLESWIKLIDPINTKYIGSSLKFCLMAEGKFTIYPRNIPTMEWDTAAGQSILKSSGGNIFTLNGLELYYGKKDLKNKSFVAFGKTPTFPKSKFFFEKCTNFKNYEKKINLAVKSLKQGKLVIFPTETVYGIGAIGNNKKAIWSIYLAKNRPKNNPLIAHFYDLNQVKKYVHFNQLASDLANHFWPGPLTIVLNIIQKNKLSEILSRGEKTLGVRIPSHPVALDLIHKLNYPILAPSANKSGGVSPTSTQHVKSDFKNMIGDNWEISDILDFESCEIGIESTVIDCRSSNLKILREGFITSEKIKNLLGINISKNKLKKKIISPGMMKKHYAPKTKVLINQEKYIEGSGCLYFGNIPKQFQKCKFQYNLSLSKNLLEASNLLYEGLRYLDKFNLNYIQVLPIPTNGIGKALNDRLKRAAYD